MGKKLCGCCRAAFPASAYHRHNLRWRGGLVCLPRAAKSSGKLWAHGQTLLTWRTPFSPHCFRAGARLEINDSDCKLPSLVSPRQRVGAHICVMFALGSPPELSVSSASSKVSFSLLLVRKRTKTIGFNTHGAKKLKSCNACKERKHAVSYFFLPNPSLWLFAELKVVAMCISVLD